MCFPMLRTHHGAIRRREVQVVFSQIIFENCLFANPSTRANLDETKQMPSRLPLLLHLAFHITDNSSKSSQTMIVAMKLSYLNRDAFVERVKVCDTEKVSLLM